MLTRNGLNDLNDLVPDSHLNDDPVNNDPANDRNSDWNSDHGVDVEHDLITALDRNCVTQYDIDTQRAEQGDPFRLAFHFNTERKHPSLPPIPPFGGGDERGKPMGSEACDLVVANLSAYQDDELDADQQQLVETHLRKCDYCASVYAAIKTTDRLVEREWRAETPLPSSFEFAGAIDAIMDALPPVPAATPRFEPKRVHARTRWMRFATGMMGVFTFCGMLLSSYALGFANGRRSLPGHTLSPASPSPFLLPITNLVLPSPFQAAATNRYLTDRLLVQNAARQVMRP